MKVEDALTARARKASTDPIEAELFGSNECRARDRAHGITVHSSSPLAMCRALVSAGYDPGRPLHVYRRKTLALTVRSIGEGAKLRTNSSGVGFCAK